MTWTCSIASPQLGMAQPSGQVEDIMRTFKPMEEDRPDQICVFGNIQAPGVEE